MNKVTMSIIFIICFVGISNYINSKTKMTIEEASVILTPHIKSKFKLDPPINCAKSSCYGTGKMYNIDKSMLSLWNEANTINFVYDIKKGNNLVTIEELE